jgi:hypothetical protein
MNIEAFAPIFSQMNNRNLVMYYFPGDLVVTVPDYGFITVFFNETGESVKIKSLNKDIERAFKMRNMSSTNVKFDEATKMLTTVANFDMDAIHEFYMQLKYAINEHYGARWFYGEPLIMDQTTWNEWYGKNFKHGVEPLGDA